MKFGFLVCGPPGTGKSSNITKMLKNARIKQSFLLVDPDSLEGSTHLEKSQKAMELVKESIEKKKSFVYVATCGGLKDIMEILKSMKSAEFRTIVAIPYLKLPQAIERISKREQETPQEVIKDLHAFFQKKAEAYMSMKNLDEIYLYNNETDFNLLYSRKKKKIVCTPGDFFFDLTPYC